MVAHLEQYTRRYPDPEARNKGILRQQEVAVGSSRPYLLVIEKTTLIDPSQFCKEPVSARAGPAPVRPSLYLRSIMANQINAFFDQAIPKFIWATASTKHH